MLIQRRNPFALELTPKQRSMLENHELRNIRYRAVRASVPMAPPLLAALNKSYYQQPSGAPASPN
jgi:hypothetical protein